jgi:hypothetical protein
MKHFALVVFLAGLAVAQDTKPLAEVPKNRLLVAYQNAVIASQALQADKKAVEADQSVLNQAIVSYNDLAKKEVILLGLPADTTFNIDLVKQEVTYTVPKKEEKSDPKPDPKPETKPTK